MGALTCSLLLSATVVIQAAPSPADLARLTPPDAQVVMGANLAALRTQPAVQAWLAEHHAAWTGRGGDGEELLREAGLDPLRDVDATVVAAVDRPDGDDSWLALFGGSFDPASLAAALLRRGATVVPGVPFVLLRAAEEGSEKPFIAVLDQLVAVGDEGSVVAAASGATLGAGVVRVERAAGRLDPNATFWLAVDVPAAVRGQTRAGEDAPDAMRGLVHASRAVQRMLLHARLGEALELSAWALADSAENAGLLHDAARGLVAALRLGAQERHPELLDVLRQVRVTQSDREVNAAAVIPVALLESLAASADKGHGDPATR